jgi:hypothetical protein
MRDCKSKKRRGTLGTLNQGRRVNKSSAILNKKLNVFLLLLVITVQVNVSNYDLGVTKGATPDPGNKKASRNNLNLKIENDVILLSFF